MIETTESKELRALDVFVGEWDMTSSLVPDPALAPRARTAFEWLSGRQFLVQRWEVDAPEAPDGIAIIGFEAVDETFLQHYFDSRGVSRVYIMTLKGKVWTLVRMAASPDFSQRFIGSFSDDGNTIDGRWERSSDGLHWTSDFDLTYRRVV